MGTSAHDQETAHSRARLVVACAAAGVLLLYALGGYFGARLLRRYAAETEKIRQEKIVAATTDPASRGSAAGPGASSRGATKPVEVTVALKVTHIGEVALKDSAWTAKFNIAFRWKGDAVAPGKDFLVANGQIEQREKVEDYQRGEERYQEYRVVARMAKSFDAARFPFGDEALVVEIEDSTHRLGELTYVADQSNSGVSPDATTPSARLARTLVGATVRSERPARSAHSLFFVAMLIASDSVPIYSNLFQALFAAVAVALIVFFIKPVHVDPRFGLPVGGFFAAVSNNNFVSGLLPSSDRLTLAAMVNATGLLTIFLVLVESAVSLYILDTLGNERLSRLLDRTFFLVTLLGYVAVNLALPLAAHSS